LQQQKPQRRNSITWRKRKVDKQFGRQDPGQADVKSIGYFDTIGYFILQNEHGNIYKYNLRACKYV
jgi:hypothetical protein